ncbi:MAG: polymer-forming cytoskeletal protein [Anaerolineae bacterium]|jgi:cytoskeletal protein CcmA (bactofilin family)
MKENRPAFGAVRSVQVLAALVLALAGWFALPAPAQADWSLVGDTVPAGQVVDNDVLATGTDVVIDGTIQGDLFAFGTTVTVNGPVTGSIVTVARAVTLNGEVGGSVYSVGRTLRLGSASYVEGNLHYAGLLLDSQRGSRIGRDLVAATIRGQVSSEIGRTLNALILLLTFNGRIGGGLEGPAEGAFSDPAAEVGTGDTLLFIGADNMRPVGLAQGLGLVAPSLAMFAASPTQQTEGAGDAAGPPEWLLARLGELAILLLVGGLALWLRPVLIQSPTEWLRQRPLPAAGLGVVAVAIAINAVAIAILLAALLLVIGIWLGGVTLWELAFIFWGIGYPALILAFSVFALAVLYGSKAIVASLVGSLILKRLAPRSLRYRILPLLLGLVLYILLRSIPTLGWAIEVIVIILGLGAMWVALRQRYLPVAEQEPREDLVPIPAAAVAGASTSDLGLE